MSPAEPFELSRFVQAQDGVYAQALSEIRAGRKRTHWMWFIFPQIQGLGSSPMARRYAIAGRAEAEAYLAHPLLGTRLAECMDAVLALAVGTVAAAFGYPDDLKLRSCATLFAEVSPPSSRFHQVLDRHFGGHPDEATLTRLARAGS